MVNRNVKHVVMSLGTLAAGTVAALVAASCAQNDRGDPVTMQRALAATINPTIIAPPTATFNDPCRANTCPIDKNPCTYHCRPGPTGSAECGNFPTVCDDRNQCTSDSCNTSTGICDFVANSNECNDGDPCTTNDVCARGTCGGKALGCDDNNVCTSDNCKAGECIHTAVAQGTDCDDQNGCTNGDSCNSNGVCVGSGGPDCDDGNPCTKNGCENSACYNNELELVGTPCLNPNMCLVNAACNAQGECTSAEQKNCDDNNPCTVDSCDPDIGCVSEPDDGAACDDGNVCTLQDTCVDGVCTPETGISCEPLDDCHEAGECDPSNGICSDPRKPDGVDCENTGTCQAGRCVGGTPDPTGEGGAPASGEGGDTAVGEGGVNSTGGTQTGDAGDDAGGRSTGGRTGTGGGGRGAGAPAADAGDTQGPADEQEFKRDPGGCSVAPGREPATSGTTGLFALLGLGALGLLRRGRGR